MKRLATVVMAGLIVFMLASIRVSANPLYGVPYDTYTLGADGRLIPTQTAYLPVGQFGTEAGLSAPQDLFYHERLVYVADGGNKRILAFGLAGEVVKVYDSPEFRLPTGVYCREGKVYVADKEARMVFVLSASTGEIIRRIEKPTSPLFGQSNKFIPTKVAVDAAENIYVVGEGSTSGIIHLTGTGEFVGYIGINPVRFSLRRILYNFFIGKEDQAASRPPAPTNIALGSKGSVLSTNDNVRETFKRINLQGTNTLRADTYYPEKPVDIWMSAENYIYLVSASGWVYEYDETGNLLFAFNTNDAAKTQALGLTYAPSAVCVDASGNLYVLDRNYNVVQVYQRTVFVTMVHNALSAYNNGRYAESKPLWREIIKHNASFALAHSALGEALLKEENYREALDEFYTARDYHGYSNAYWQVRNDYIQKYLALWVGIFVAIYLGYLAVRAIRKRRHFALVPAGTRAWLGRFKPLRELGQAPLALRKPGELFYRVKRDRFGYAGAFVLFFLFIIVYLIDLYGSGFLFRESDPGNALYRLVIVAGVFLLYVAVNYLMSTFSDGEGKFREVFVSSCYALLPYIILTLPMTLLSHYLTYNESFIHDFYRDVTIGWTLFLLIFSMKRIHNYSFWETVKNVILILFAMVIIVVVGLLVYSFIGQLLDFIVSVIKEVIYFD